MMRARLAEKRFCKRCLLSEDRSQQVLSRTVAEYIALLSIDEKTPDADYRDRLTRCKQCDELLSGLCRVCGCYVEARAAKARMHCPGPDKRW